MAHTDVRDPAAAVRAARRRFVLMLILCLTLLMLRMLDLALWTDPATGFVQDDWFFLRPALPLAVALLSYLTARKAAPRPAQLLGACPPLGFCMLAVGAALAAAALLAAPELLTAGAAGLPLVLLRCVCAALSALWFLRYGARAFAPLADPAAPLPGTLNALAGIAFFLCTLILRFTVQAASVQRLGCTLRVLSAAMAVVFLISLFRVFLTPGLPAGSSLFASGFNAFLFCTCHELPQAAFEWYWGRLSLGELAVSLALALLALAGAVRADRACGPAAALPREGQPAQQPE